MAPEEVVRLRCRAILFPPVSFVTRCEAARAGADVPMWRRAWRDKILPAVVRFRPDLVLVSAGFDAHRKDDMNFRYIGIQERDYEWLTDQIVQARAPCAPLPGKGRSGCRCAVPGCPGSGMARA
jgi:hypothetical protein